MKRSLFVGRFQPFHNAHLSDIIDILKEIDEVIIAIGSSQEFNTSRNPFSYSERKEMIEDVLENHGIENYRIYPVPDFHDDNKWVIYIKNNLPEYEFVYSGNPWTLRCFKEHDSKLRKIRLIRGISSTIIRNMLINNESWQNLVPKEIVSYINRIKGVERIIRIAANIK